MNLFVNAIGMVTALGHDAATSCAAIRAGLTRAAPVPDAQVLDPDSQSMVPLIGHAVWGLTEGKAATARWITMATCAFNDLRRSAALPGAQDLGFWRRTALVIVAPPLDDDRFVFSLPCHADMISDTYVAPLIRGLHVPIDADRSHFLSVGRTGAVTAFVGAESLLAKGTVDRVIVVAADSYLDGHSLQWLSESDRLKSAEHPTGLMPGEAAVAVLVSGAPVGRAPGVRIRAASVASEDDDYFTDGPKHGRALALALQTALGAAGVASPFVGEVYTDLNGESWRAYEFGAALAQVPASVLQAGPFITPAMSTGDVGAASALVAVAASSRAFEREYARFQSVVITCMSPSGRVGALVVGRS